MSPSTEESAATYALATGVTGPCRVSDLEHGLRHRRYAFSCRTIHLNQGLYAGLLKCTFEQILPRCLQVCFPAIVGHESTVTQGRRSDEER
jgi:hypothetical protein